MAFGNLSRRSERAGIFALRGEAAEDVEPIGRGIRSEEIGNGGGGVTRAAQELHEPFGDALAGNVLIEAGLGFIDHGGMVVNEGERGDGIFSW